MLTPPFGSTRSFCAKWRCCTKSRSVRFGCFDSYSRGFHIHSTHTHTPHTHTYTPYTHTRTHTLPCTSRRFVGGNFFSAAFFRRIWRALASRYYYVLPPTFSSRFFAFLCCSSSDHHPVSFFAFSSSSHPFTGDRCTLSPTVIFFALSFLILRRNNRSSAVQMHCFPLAGTPCQYRTDRCVAVAACVCMRVCELWLFLLGVVEDEVLLTPFALKDWLLIGALTVLQLAKVAGNLQVITRQPASHAVHFLPYPDGRGSALTDR